MLIRHAGLYLLAKGIPSAIGFLSIIFYTRHLSPVEYGKYALVIVIVNLLNSVMFQWLRLGLLRFLPGTDNENVPKFMSTVAINFFLLVIGISCVGCASMFIFSEYSRYILWGMAILFLQAWFDLNQTLFRTKLMPIKLGISLFVKTFSSFVISLSLIYFGWKENSLLAGMTIGFFFSFIGVTLKEWRFIRLKLYDSKQFIKLLRYGLPLTVTFAMAFIIQGTDRILLGWLGGTKETGVYSIASDFTQQSLLMIMMIINMGAFPIVVKKLEEEGREAATKQLRQNAILLLAISIPAMFGIIMLMPNVAYVVFGSTYRESVMHLVPLLIISSFFLGFKSYYYDQCFQLGKNTYKQIIPVLIAAIVNLLLNFILDPRWGADGAAIASIVAYSIALLLSWKIGNQVFFAPFPFKECAQIISVGLVMCIALIPVKDLTGPVYLVFQVFYGMFIYSLGIIGLNIFGVRSLIKNRFKTKKTARMIN